MKFRIPKTVSFSGEKLSKMKNENQVPASVLSELKERADGHLSGELLAVTERVMRAITENPHDYASIGTYWWPNPDTPDGLPYVRRDGEGIPMATDTVTYRKMAERAFELALAAYYFDSEEYGRAAERVLYDWHINPETYMTPHAKYAQSIPGICDGRGIGIIDFSMSSYRVFDTVAILESLGFIDEETVVGLKAWYNEFTDWLLTSECGIEEDCEPNNHGSYSDVQLLASAVFTGREALVKKICTTAYERRLRAHVESDGRQPLELRRTMAMVYSISNLRSLMLISGMAADLGYTEYLSQDSKYGDSIIKKALDYLYPYAVSPESFPYQELNFDIVPERMKALLIWADRHFIGEGYGEKADSISGELVLESVYPGV